MGLGCWYLRTIRSALKRFWRENALRLSMEERWLNVAIANVDYSVYQRLSLGDRFVEEGVEKSKTDVSDFDYSDENLDAIRTEIDTFLREKGRLRKALWERREDVRELRALRIIDKTRRKALRMGVISWPQPEDKNSNRYMMYSRVTGEPRLNGEGLKRVRENIREERNARLEPLVMVADFVSKLSPVVAGLLGYLLGLVLAGL